MIPLHSVDLAVAACLKQKLNLPAEERIVFNNVSLPYTGYAVAIVREKFDTGWPELRKFDAVVRITGNDADDMSERVDRLLTALPDRTLYSTSFDFSLSFLKQSCEFEGKTGTITFSLSAFIPNAAGFPQLLLNHNKR